MKRGYQLDYSKMMPSVFDVEGRTRKAKTIHTVLTDFIGDDLSRLSLLTIGTSSGVIDRYLSDYLDSVVGMDIDQNAITHASKNYQKTNLSFLVGDGMKVPFPSQRFNIVICSHVYEHVPDAAKLMSEIYRVLVPGGVCYFAAGNRLNLMEPHYRLPFLSIIPRPLAHLYMRLTGKGSHYYERHFTVNGIRKLVSKFSLNDYTCKMIEDPGRFNIEYMLTIAGRKQQIARIFCRYAYWLLPGYIWILQKKDDVIK